MVAEFADSREADIQVPERVSDAIDVLAGYLIPGLALVVGPSEPGRRILLVGGLSDDDAAEIVAALAVWAATRAEARAAAVEVASAESAVAAVAGRLQ